MSRGYAHDMLVVTKRFRSGVNCALLLISSIFGEPACRTTSCTSRYRRTHEHHRPAQTLSV